MFEIHKSYVLDENQNPIAVQIPIAKYEQIEEILENYGLIQLMEPTTDEDNDRLSGEDALEYYRSLKLQINSVQDGNGMVQMQSQQNPVF